MLSVSVEEVILFLEVEQYFCRDTPTHPEDKEYDKDLSVKQESYQITQRWQALAQVNSHQAHVTTVFQPLHR